MWTDVKWLVFSHSVPLLTNHSMSLSVISNTVECYILLFLVIAAINSCLSLFLLLKLIRQKNCQETTKLCIQKAFLCWNTKSYSFIIDRQKTDPSKNVKHAGTCKNITI